MSDETITQAERERMRECADGVARYHTERARYGGASREFHILAETLLKVDVPRLIDALAEAEKRAEEAEQAVEELTPVVLAAPAVQRMVEDGAREAAQLRAALARLQPLIDVARAYAAVPGDRFASPEEDDLRGAALALFPEEVRRG